MNKHQQLKVAAFLEELYEAECALDLLKKELLNCNNYSPDLLFDRLSEQKQSISASQLENYLEGKLRLSNKQMYEIFCRFDWSRQGTINRKDFLNEIYPRGYKNKNLNNPGKLTVEIEALFIQLLREYIRRYRVIEVARKQISQIAPYNIFDHIATENKGYLGEQELKNFLNANDFDVSPQQLSFLVYALRRRIYTHINLEVFCESLYPLQFGMYQTYLEGLNKQQEENYLRRSRHQDESMRRSRVDNHKIANEQRKAERRIIADLENQKQQQQTLRRISNQNLQVQERLRRKQILEAEKYTRYNLQTDHAYLAEQAYLAETERRRLAEIEAVKRAEEERFHRLNSNLYEGQIELQKSRKIIDHQKERLYQEEIKNQIRKQRLLREAQRQKQEAILEKELMKKKLYEQQLYKQNLKRSQQFERIRIRDQERMLQRERLQREQRLIQMQRLQEKDLSRYVPQIDVPLYKYEEQSRPYRRYREEFENRKLQEISPTKTRNIEEQLNIIRSRRNQAQKALANTNNIYINNSPTKLTVNPAQTKTPNKQFELDRTRTDLESKKKRMESELKKQTNSQYNKGLLEATFYNKELKTSYIV